MVWSIVWREFKKHTLAKVGLFLLFIFYFIATTCGFLAPHNPNKRSSFTYMPPQRIRFVDDGKLQRPFVYEVESGRDPETFQKVYKENKDKKHPIRFFVKGETYKFLGFYKTDIHLFGTKEGAFYPLGTDELGRGMLSRILHGARLSLSIGLIGIFLSLILGVFIGGVSGYYGGKIDTVIQRIIEVLLTIPKIPLWMGLAAAVPSNWSVIQMYFAITIILSIVNWAGLARVVRGGILSLKTEEFSEAARAYGASESRIIVRHLIPNFMSYLLVHLTLGVPNMIIAETSLSFLGLGLRPPAISWGVLLKNAQNIQSVATYPWMLLPGIAVVLAVLAFNFVGDGIRDAADPFNTIQ